MSEKTTGVMAIITTKPENITGGGVPVFIAENKKVLQEVSNRLEKVLDASAHEVDPDTMIIVAH